MSPEYATASGFGSANWGEGTSVSVLRPVPVLHTRTGIGTPNRIGSAEVDQAVAVPAFGSGERKVRAPQGRILRNAEWGRP